MFRCMPNSACATGPRSRRQWPLCPATFYHRCARQQCRPCGIEPAHEASLDDWEQMVDTDLQGLPDALPPARQVECKRGHVTNLGSVADNYPSWRERLCRFESLR